MAAASSTHAQMSVGSSKCSGSSPPLGRPLPAVKLYSELGWSTIPVNGTSKMALVAWKEFTERRPTLAEIQRWGVRFGNAGIAVITGPVSQIVVLDADGQQGVDEARRRGIPKTPTVRTPRGGAHYYFRLPPDLPNIINGAKLGESRCLDVRGHAGYVVAPFTQREDGKKYEWEIRPEATALAMPPSWFLSMLRANAASSALKAKPKKIISSGGGSSHGDDDLEAFIDTLRFYTQKLIREGHDLTIYPSRSECDLEVMVDLLAAGADEETIERIFGVYPIGEKYQEVGSHYLHRTISKAEECVRVVRIKYADAPNSLEPRFRVAFEVIEGSEQGNLIRSGFTVPADDSAPNVLKRWERFFHALDMDVPTIELRSAASRMVGKKLRIWIRDDGKMGYGAFNPVVAFYRY